MKTFIETTMTSQEKIKIINNLLKIPNYIFRQKEFIDYCTFPGLFLEDKPNKTYTFIQGLDKLRLVNKYTPIDSVYGLVPIDKQEDIKDYDSNKTNSIILYRKGTLGTAYFYDAIKYNSGFHECRLSKLNSGILLDTHKTLSIYDYNTDNLVLPRYKIINIINILTFWNGKIFGLLNKEESKQYYQDFYHCCCTDKSYWHCNGMDSYLKWMDKAIKNYSLKFLK